MSDQGGSPRANSNMFNMTRLFSFVVLLGVIVVIGVLSYKVMHTFVLPLFLAALLVVIFEPVHEWVIGRCRGNKPVAAGLTSATILLVVLAPIVWVVTVGVMEAMELMGTGTKASMAAASQDEPGVPIDPLDPIREVLRLQLPYKDTLNELELELAALQLDQEKSIALSTIRNTGPVIDEFATSVSSFQLQLDADLKELDGQSDSPADTKRQSDRLERVRLRLTKMDDPVTQLRELLTQIRQLPDSGVTTAHLRTYDELVKHVGDSYRAVRVELLGGSFWAPVKSFANPSEEQLRTWKTSITDKLRAWMLQLTGRTPSLMGSFFMQLFVLSIAIYYFLLDGPQLVQAAIELSPMEDQYEHELIAEFAKLSRAVVLATLLSALAQGILAGVGYFAIFGFNSLFLLVILTTLLAMVPFVGAAAVWVPVCLYVAFYEKSYWAAGGLALWGFLVVSMADNVIKPYVLKGQSNLHPLFALLSVLGGVQALGPIGVLVGPMVVAFLQALLNILHRVLKHMDGGEASGSVRLAAGPTSPPTGDVKVAEEKKSQEKPKRKNSPKRNSKKKG